MRTPPLRRRLGMTLLEVMAAAALMAVMFAMVFGWVFSTMRTRDAIEQLALPYAAGPSAMNLVVRDLQCCQTDALKDDQGFRLETEDVGGTDAARIDMVTATPSRDMVEIRGEWARAQLNEVGYRLRRSEIGPGLYTLYRREDFGVDDEPMDGGKYYKLCDRVREFVVDVFKEDPDEPGSEAAKGEQEWDSSKHKERSDNKLPWGARVRLTIEGIPAEDGENPPVYVFETYVAFRTRHDKTDKAGN